MASTRLRRTAAIVALASAALIALPGITLASTNPQIAATGGMTASLPILGGGVSVTVALDPAGNISGVTVGSSALTQSSSPSPDFVKFATTDGKTRVTVRAMGSRLSISARVTTLAELVGTGTWSANVFGNGVSSAQYTIGNDGSGNPTVTLADPSPLASGVTWQAAAPKTSTDKDGSQTSAGGTFSYNGFTKALRVTVTVDKGEDGQPGSASLKITLTGRDVQSLTGTLASLAAAGTRTWSGYLCDGKTQVTVSYQVNPDGTIAFDGATGAKAVSKTTKSGLMVWFSGNPVGLNVRLKQNADGTTYTLKVSGFSGMCGKSHKHHESWGWNNQDQQGQQQGDTRTGSWSGSQTGWTGGSH